MKTFVLIKSDAIEARQIAPILERFERRGFIIEEMKMVMMTEERLIELYKEHKDRDYYQNLINAMKGKKAIAIILSVEDEDAVKIVREMVGSTHCAESSPGTIRGDFGIGHGPRNRIHASDSTSSYLRESKIFFS